MNKISGPLLDRIDIHIEVPAVDFAELSGTSVGTSSEMMRQSVIQSRQIQKKRFVGSTTRHNAQMSSREVRRFCQLRPNCRDILRNSVHDMGLSARAHDKILRVRPHHR